VAADPDTILTLTALMEDDRNRPAAPSYSEGGGYGKMAG
jgi:hypothetical protein